MKFIRLPLSVVFAFLLLSSGCARYGESLPPEVITGLRTTFNAGDSAAVAAMFTDDGAVMPRFGAPIKGTPAIQQYMEKTLRRQLQFWINSEASVVSGDLAYDEGNYKIRDIRRNVDLDTGRYVNVFKRVGGQWKIYRSIFSSYSVPNETNVLIGSAESENGQ